LFEINFGTGIKRNNPGKNSGIAQKVCTKPYQEGTGFIRRYKFYFIFKGYMDLVSTDLDFGLSIE
jgi:hypothetical protein